MWTRHLIVELPARTTALIVPPADWRLARCRAEGLRARRDRRGFTARGAGRVAISEE